MKIFLYYSVLLVFLFITASLQDGLQVMSFTCSENGECAEGECCLEGKCEELDECKVEDYSAENKSNTWVIYVVAFGTLFLILLPTFIIACCCCCAASALHRPAKESAHINQPGPAVITTGTIFLVNLTSTAPSSHTNLKLPHQRILNSEFRHDQRQKATYFMTV